LENSFNIGYESVLEAMKVPIGVVRVQILALGVTVEVMRVPIEAMRIENPQVCKSHD
jgi:hypothetical protein